MDVFRSRFHSPNRPEKKNNNVSNNSIESEIIIEEEEDLSHKNMDSVMADELIC